MRGVSVVALGAMGLLALGCSASGGSDNGGNAGGGGSGGNASGGSGAGLAIDGSPGDGGPGACPNVDVLFVIDNSASMSDQQQSLINSFGGFVDGIQQRLTSAKSIHVGVVTTDDYYSNAAGCTSIGSLVTKTGGINSSNATCTPFSSGASFLDESEPDMATKFACIGKVGTGGNDDERPMLAAMEALDPANNAPGTCNAGFSRLDSLLVLVVISDEDDVAEPYGCIPGDANNPCDTTGSGGDPDQWHATIVSHKGGYEQNIVALSLIGRSATNTCGAVVASKLLGFANRFQNGYIGDVCAASYDQFFAEALPIIDTACVSYVPPR